MTERQEFELAFLSARMRGVDEAAGVFARVVSDPRPRSPELAHALSFGTQGLSVERGIVLRKLEAARQAGATLPTETVASSVGAAAGALRAVWGLAQWLGYLRAADATHPLILEASTAVTDTTDAAWNELRDAVSASGRAILDARLARLDNYRRFQPAASSAKHAKLIDWTHTIDEYLNDFTRDLDIRVDPVPATGPTPVEAAVLARIIANPEDIPLRLQLAELAALRNDPLAELIRSQVALSSARPLERGKLSERIRQLLASYPAWTAELRDLGATDVGHHNGFPYSVNMTADAFIANGVKVVARAPIRSVMITSSVKGRGKEIASSSALAKLHKLNLTNTAATDADLVAIAASPNAGALRALMLSQNKLTDVALEAIASSPHLRHLEDVHFNLNPGRNPIDEIEFHQDGITPYRVPTEEGRALEAKYGPLRWLHPPVYAK